MPIQPPQLNALALTFIVDAISAQHGPVFPKRRQPRPPGLAELKRLGQEMKNFAYLIATFALLSHGRLHAADDTSNFVDHFHDDANIPIYVTLIDGLIDAGEAKIYASMEDEKKDPESPRAKTPNGILMLYTVAQTPDGVLMHFSTSRAPYLPVALGKHIVGLFMARSGWPKPAVFQVSDHQVFHAIWIVPASQFAQIQKALPELRAKIKRSEDAKAAFLRGLLRAGDLENKPNQTSEPMPASGRGSP